MPLMVHSEAEIRARRILAGEPANPQELLALARELQGNNAFHYARRILWLASQSPEAQNNREFWRRCMLGGAVCTYKDQELPADDRLRTALEMISGVDDLSQTRDQEVLGLAGAVHKRQYEIYARKEYLERAAAYYLRGYEIGIANDLGYCAINAALMLDMLGTQEQAAARSAGSRSETAPARFEQATRIRYEILTALREEAGSHPEIRNIWFFFATLAEAAFGLRRYEEAAEFLLEAKSHLVESWHFQTSAHQLSVLARLQADQDGSPLVPAGSEVVWKAAGMAPDLVRSASAGKIGLALSGGGFRAALFHIGVLARLAELDVLRYVEVISAVSGGSILAVYYYLELKHLLESKADAEITRDDYLELVGRLEREFLAGVQRNIRVRTRASVISALSGMFLPYYSSAYRFGEVLETELLARTGEKVEYLTDLRIKPRGSPDRFSPKYDNWTRASKVPVLILNATTLNTGHNWQFTSTWMGEPPASGEPDIDGQDRLRRMYYEEAPPAYRRFRVRDALAASACTPGLFEPVPLRGLYEKLTVRLVDGGVYDNQGIGGLLENECNVLVVSDGSGIASTMADPTGSALSVMQRANDILFSRVRGTQYRDLRTRLQASVLRGLVFLHLKKDLSGRPRDWIDSPERFAVEIDRRSSLTSYGIDREVQARLSELRSDYDSFNDVEAFALMTSGYAMAKQEIPQSAPSLDTPVATPYEWRFLMIERSMRLPRDANLLRVLQVGRWRSFKAFRLLPRLAWGTAIGAILPAGVVIAALLRLPPVQFEIDMRTVVTLGGAALALVILIPLLVTRKDPIQVVSSLFYALFGWLLAAVHLRWTDRLFLQTGSFHPGERAESSAPQRRGSAATAVVNQALIESSVRRIIEAAGCRTQPAQAAGTIVDAGLDLIANDGSRFYCVSIKSGGPGSRPVDWTAASALKRASWNLTLGQDAIPSNATLMMILVDVPADPSLERFAETEGVVLLHTSAREIERVLRTPPSKDEAREFLRLRAESAP